MNIIGCAVVLSCYNRLVEGNGYGVVRDDDGTTAMCREIG